MSRFLGAVFENAYGLLVDDGSLAVGAVAAVAVAWLFAAVAPDRAADLDGALLLVLVCALVLGNLFVAGRRIARDVR